MKKLLLVVSILSAFALTACGGKSNSESNTLNLVLLGEPKTLDNSKATDVYSSEILSMVNEGLVSVEVQEDGSEKIMPGVAKEWTISPDGKKLTFKLNENAKWSDGKTVVAQDFVYGMLRTLDPKTASQYSFLMSPIKGADAYNSGKGKAEDVGVKAIDDSTLEITLGKPTAYIEQILYFKALFPQRQDIVEKSGDKYGTEANTLIFNGPFVMTEWTHGSKVVFEKNPNYWDKDNVKLDKVVKNIVLDETARMQMLLNGQTDLDSVYKPEWITKLDATKNFITVKSGEFSTNYAFFNQKNKYFKNKKIRQAFSIATDRDGENKVLFENTMQPAYGFVTVGTKIGGKDYRSLVPEPVKQLIAENPDAKKLLIEGLKELGLPEDPAQMDITYLSGSTTDKQRKYVEYLQQEYKTALGVEMKTDAAEWAVFQKRVDELDYDFSGMAWAGDYNDPNTFLDMWVSNAGIIQTGWANKEYDKLIAEASETADQNKRLELFAKAEDIVTRQEAVIAPTLYRMSTTYIRNYVKGYRKPTLKGVYNLKGVYLEKK